MQTYQAQDHPAASGPTQAALGLINAWNSHDVEAITSFYAPEYEGVDVGQAHPERGIEGRRLSAERYLRAYPDLYVELEQVVSEGDVVMTSWVARGTHLGTLMGIPPSGRKISVRGTSTFKFERGGFVRAVYVWDVAGMLREIGLLPEL
jgi:steroid delta-isomerase-like uncharacterized protein